MFHPILLAAVPVLLCGTLNLRAEDAKPSGGEITELKQVTAEIPHEVLLGLMNNSGREAAAAKGSDVLSEKVEGRAATLKFKVDRVEKEERRDQAAPEAYRILAEETHVRQGAANFKVYLWVHFSASESAKVSVMKKGADVTATGKVTVAKLRVPKESVINIDLSDATVK